MPTEDLLDNRETAELLRIAPGTLRQWRMVGKGPQHVRLSKLVYYKRRTVERYLAELPEYSFTKKRPKTNGHTQELN